MQQQYHIVFPMLIFFTLYIVLSLAPNVASSNSSFQTLFSETLGRISATMLLSSTKLLTKYPSSSASCQDTIMSQSNILLSTLNDSARTTFLHALLTNASSYNAFSGAVITAKQKLIESGCPPIQISTPLHATLSVTQIHSSPMAVHLDAGMSSNAHMPIFSADLSAECRVREARIADMSDRKRLFLDGVELVQPPILTEGLDISEAVLFTTHVGVRGVDFVVESAVPIQMDLAVECVQGAGAVRESVRIGTWDLGVVRRVLDRPAVGGLGMGGRFMVASFRRGGDDTCC